ncbi:MAG: FecR domain-containing protein [Deltaproteobacteria bacterium]|nr:FecR domain-containing protein [Deltaproteobacteria bacterium]
MTEPTSKALQRLRALDQATARRGASVQTRERLRRRLRHQAAAQPFVQRLRWWPVIAFAAGAITMALFVAKGLSTPSTSPRAEATEPSIAVAQPTAKVAEDATSPAAATSPPCAEPVDGPMHLAADGCAQGQGVRLTAVLETQLQWTTDRIELQSGELIFDVDPRPERPLHVVVGALDVEVVGTRFIVHGGEPAWISVLEGHVRVRASGGPPQDLLRGQRFEQPRPEPPPTTTPTPSRRRTEPRAPRNVGLDACLEQVAKLRREGSYREAVQRLRDQDQRGWTARARQLISYEIGTLLERQIGDAPAACAHWSEHQRRYPKGRHAQIVSRALTRLGCEDSG